jgi:hypothetical protein
VIRVGKGGLRSDGLFEQGDGFVVPAIHLGDCREAVECPGIRRINRDCPLKKLRGGHFVLPVPEVEIAEDHPVGCVGRIEPQNLDEVIGGLFCVASLHQAHRKIPSCCKKRWLKLERPFQQFDGVLEIPGGSPPGRFVGEP